MESRTEDFEEKSHNTIDDHNIHYQKPKKTRILRKKKSSSKEPSLQKKNYNTFFAGAASNQINESNLPPPENHSRSKSSEDSMMNENNSESPAIGNDDIKAAIDNLKSEMLHQFSEFSQDLKMLSKQVAAIEVLVKFHKKPDPIHLQENYVTVLKEYGLPIESKVKLDEIEKSLEDDKFKTRMVNICMLI